jgi:ribosomal protein S12
MSTIIRSDGFRLSLSGVSVISLIAGLVFIIRLDEKANTALKKFDVISQDVSGLRYEMARDREVLHEHGAEIREHRAMIHELQRRSKNANGWGE